jgi:CBS domain containing-hemolysin-like protein
MKKNQKKEVSKKNKINWNWIIKIVIITFVISILFSFVSETAIPNLNVFLGVILTLLFVLIGVIFDMVGVAVTASDEYIFHSMAAKKVRGAKLAVKFKKNADKLSSFCQDVIGDICGIVSGSTGAVISIKIMQQFNTDSLIITLVVMGIISSLTIGGKALEKAIAMNKSNEILYKFSYVMSFFIKE